MKPPSESLRKPSPSAQPIVCSSSDYTGRLVQMPQPFGSGIGIKPQVVDPSNYKNSFTNASCPHDTRATPLSAHYQNYAQQSQHSNYSNYSQTSQPQILHQNYQNTQSFKAPNDFQSKIYPNLNQIPNYSYAHSYPGIHRATSFTPKVIVLLFNGSRENY